MHIQDDSNPLLFASHRYKLKRAIKKLPNLLFYYPMDETSGTTIFNRAPTSITRDATNVGITIGQPGKVGSAYSFDGVNDRGDIPVGSDFKSSTALSVGVIINVVDNAATKGIYYEDRAGNTTVPRVQLSLDNTEQVRFVIRTAFSDSAEASIVTDNSYSGLKFVIATVDIPSETFILYVNGVSQSFTGSTTMTNNSITVSNTSTNPRIGCTIGGGTIPQQFFNSTMQHLFGVRQVITQAQVTKLTKLSGFSV